MPDARLPDARPPDAAGREHPAGGHAGALPGSLLQALRAVVGDRHVLTDPEVRSSYERDWTGRFGGPSLAVVRPGTTTETAAVLAACAGARVPVVPQGGNTGLVGGGVPGPAGGVAPVVVSAVRLDHLDRPDVVAGQVTAGAGVPLVRLQEAAAAVGWSFPVDLAARQSATVGGMVATNAGGLHVLRYGSMRAQVLGLEAVLADGQVISRLDGLVKDNTGYDLSQLLVGSEGTLAFVTAARLRLVPDLSERVVALVGLPGMAAALDVVSAIRRRASGLEAAEIFFADGLDLVCAHGGLPRPLPGAHPAYLVVECAGHDDPSTALFAALADLDLPDDATAIATDGPGRQRLWAYRERHTEAIASTGVAHKLDVTLPVDRLADFVTEVRAAVADTDPAATVFLFGHLGDGNLHVNVTGLAPDDERVDDAVLRLVLARRGSISAEHGIGRAKAAWMPAARSRPERDMMRAVKAAWDPDGVLNPGVLLTTDLTADP